MRAIAYRQRIPLIGKSPLDGQFRNPRSPLSHALRGTLTSRDINKIVSDSNPRIRPMVVIKPGRRLGGAWMDELVARRKVVELCGDCLRKYRDWWTKVGYEPRDKAAFSDCDGCGRELVPCRSFYSRLSE